MGLTVSIGLRRKLLGKRILKWKKKKPSKNKAAIEIYQAAPLIKDYLLKLHSFYYSFQGSPG